MNFKIRRGSTIGHRKEAVAIVLVGICLYSAAFLNLAFYSDLGSSNPYTLLVYGLPLVVLKLLAIVIVNRFFPLPVFALILALIFLYFLDLVGIADGLQSYIDKRFVMLIYAGIFFLTAFLVYINSEVSVKFMAGFSVVILVTSVAGNLFEVFLGGQPAKDESSNVPLSRVVDSTSDSSVKGSRYFHIVLDSTISQAGALRVGNIETARAIGKHINALSARGFMIRSNAYSHHRSTAESLSGLFNFDVSTDLRAYSTEKNGNVSQRLTANAWFGHLEAQNLSVDVYQPGWLDFCEIGPVEHCETVAYHSIPDMSTYDASNAEKSAIAHQILANVSRLQLLVKAKIYYTLYEKSPEAFRKYLPKYGGSVSPSALNAIVLFERMSARAAVTSGSDVVLLHMLLPHEPFVLDSDCKIKKPSQWWNSSMPWVKNSGALFDRLYASQVDCAAKLVTNFIDQRLEANPDTQFFIHGDHGARERFGGSNVEEFADIYSTFMASRGVHTEPGVDSELISLTQGFVDYLCNGSDMFKADCTISLPENHDRYLDNTSGTTGDVSLKVPLNPLLD